MELRQYVQIAVKWLWLVILGALLAGGAAYLMVRNLPPIYRATTTLYVSGGSGGSLTDYSDVYASQQIAKTFGELLQKRSLLEQTLLRLGYTQPSELDVSVDVSPIRETQLIELNVESTNPALAQQVANELPLTFTTQYAALRSGRYAELLAGLQSQLARIQKDIDETQKALDQARNSTTLSYEARQAEITRLDTILSAYRSSYSSLLESYEQTRLASAQAVSNLMIAEPASLPKGPVGPHKTRNVLLAALVGMMLAAGMAFLIEYLDDTIKTPADAERVAGLTTLGSLAHVRGVKDAQDVLVTSKRPKSSMAEAYRMTRAMMQIASGGSDKDYLISSTSPQEGKTTTVANLGVVMAQAGHRTVLVDADLRRPTLHRIFGVPNMRGLSLLLLRDDVDVASALANTSIEGLTLLPSGVIPPSPAELLGSPRMDRVISQLKDLADVIIFDCPPVLAASDASILAAKLKQAILVVYAGRTRSEDLRRAKDMLAVTGIALQGVILNRTPSRRGSNGYYYQYYADDQGNGDRPAQRGFSLPFLKRRKAEQTVASPDGPQG